MSHNGGRPDGLYRPNRRDLVRALGVGAASSVAGCSGAFDGDGGGESARTRTGDGTAGPAPDEPSGEYVGVVGSDANSLNWLFTNDTASGSFVGLTLDGAWAVDGDQNVFPLWAEPSTEDGRTYRITLRDNLRWSGGYGRMTADDWVYMIRNVFQGEDNWAGYTNAGDWFRQGDPIPVERIDDCTFEIRLPEVDPSFPLKPVMWGQNCLPRGILEKYVPDRDAQGLQRDEEIVRSGTPGTLARTPSSGGSGSRSTSRRGTTTTTSGRSTVSARRGTAPPTSRRTRYGSSPRSRRGSTRCARGKSRPPESRPRTPGSSGTSRASTSTSSHSRSFRR